MGRLTIGGGGRVCPRENRLRCSVWFVVQRVLTVVGDGWGVVYPASRAFAQCLSESGDVVSQGQGDFTSLSRFTSLIEVSSSIFCCRLSKMPDCTIPPSARDIFAFILLLVYGHVGRVLSDDIP